MIKKLKVVFVSALCFTTAYADHPSRPPKMAEETNHKKIVYIVNNRK